MGRDAEAARDALLRGSHSCVLVKDGAIRASDLRGIAPMAGFIDGGLDLRGSSAADRIVGKAAALLFALAGVSEVYAIVADIDEPLWAYGAIATALEDLRAKEGVA
jgi:hypothetical protein